MFVLIFGNRFIKVGNFGPVTVISTTTYDTHRLFIKQPNICSIYQSQTWRDLKRMPLSSLDSSSNNQMIVLPIIRNLGGFKKVRPKRPTKIGRNDPGRNNPGPKRLRAETTGPKRTGTPGNDKSEFKNNYKPYLNILSLVLYLFKTSWYKPRMNKVKIILVLLAMTEILASVSGLGHGVPVYGFHTRPE